MSKAADRSPDQIPDSAAADDDLENEELVESGSSSEFFKALREKAGEGGISNAQRADFKTAVALDEMKKPAERMGLKQLYAIWCEKGNAKWLNPSKELGRLREICLMYMGSVTTLQPLIQILIHLTRHSISPHAFLRYVVLPRMGDDFDWRQWRTRHFGALSIIAQMVIEIKKHPPFDKAILGSGSYRLSRDIVIIKYFARPLCALPEKELSIQEYQKAYSELWRSFYLDNSLHIYFLKRNILPVLYRYAAKLGFNQLIQILTNVPKIETAFRSFYPESHGPVDEEEMDLHLYHRDFLLSVQQREKRKFTSFHFTQELKAYVNIIAALLNARSGIYLCNFFAKILRQKKDPVIADALNRLISLIEDDGGMYIYRWHAERLISLPKGQIEIFLSEVQAGRGLHPQCPRIGHLFNHHNSETKREHLRVVAETLGIWDETMQRAYEQKNFSERTLLAHYMLLKPDAAALIMEAQRAICEGRENQWDSHFVGQLDALGGNIFRLVLKSVIPALNTGYSIGGGAMHASFGELNERYANLTVPEGLRQHHTFSINTYGQQLGNRLVEDKIRLKLNLEQIEEIFASLTAAEPASPRNLVMILNQLKMRIESSIRRLKSDIQKNANLPAGLLQRLQLVSETLEACQHGRATEQFILLLLSAAYFHQEKELRRLAINALVARYAQKDNLAEKISVLKKDIAIGALQPRQLEFLIRVCEDIVNSAVEDAEIGATLAQIRSANSTLSELCLSLSRIRAATLDALHIDGAVRKILKVNALSAEASRWLKLILAEEQTKANPARFCIRLDKSPLDYYYGQMGGTCLSLRGEEIQKPDFFILRLSNLQTREIIGFSIAVKEREKPTSVGPRRWLAFGFNVAPSMRTKFTANEKLLIYLHFRYVYEKLAQQTKTPVLLCGIGAKMIISNDEEWQKLILRFERKYRTTARAFMSDFVYQADAFKLAIVMVDPTDLKTFRAHNFFRWRNEKGTAV